jgi:hypothetical protein
MMVLSWRKLECHDDATRSKQLTKAMQNTDRHSAMVMAVSFHLVGYSKPSSSSDALACELRFSRIDGSWLCVAVLSESAMLDGLRWVLVSVMCLCREGGLCVPCLSLQVCTV